MTLRHAEGSADRLAQGLGWFSIGLGLLELAAPRSITRRLGLWGRESLVQAYGLREIATGVGILASRDRRPWIWGRVGGDALDVATLSTALRDDNPRRDNAALAFGAVLGVTVLDLICAGSLRAPRQRRPLRDYSGRSGLPRPPEAMRGAARDFEIPRDMRTPEALRPYATS